MDPAKVPAISVILPTYNRATLLRRAVQSVLSQTFQDWELIIVDDASTDDTQEVIKNLCRQDSRIINMRNEKNNYPDIAKTLNGGLAAARGKYIARIDDDDYWIDDGKLRKQYDFLESHPDHVLVGSGMIVVDKDGVEQYRFLKKENDDEIRKFALRANPFAHTTVMFRADVARRVGGYGNWDYAEDWDLWLKMGNQGKLHNIPEYLAAYTFAGQNKSFVYLRKQSRTILRFIIAHRHEYPDFWKGYFLNGVQYVYSFMPFFIRKPLQNGLASIKRRLF
jgi:glycosyltransferase involved in cell wall biosynthesis